MSRDLKAKFDVERYRPLGLVGNPFTIADRATGFSGIDLEVAAEANALLGAIINSANEAAPKPIAVLKGEGVMPTYALRAVGRTERSLAGDPGVNVLHAYVQLFMMRVGRVRAIIQILSERLAFTDFDRTLELYIAKVLAEPDSELIAFQVLAEEGLAAFTERFNNDPTTVTRELFGAAEAERHPELAEMPDVRLSGLDDNVDESDASPELDSTVGDAPANAILLGAAGEDDATQDANDDQELVDYIIEYTKVHLSPVIARALRVYRERGQVALTSELQITKAPKKTLAAIVRFARVRFKKVALIFDGFDNWHTVPTELKVQIVSTLSDVRWLLDREAIMIPLLERDRVPELEEQFGGGTRVEWDFPFVSAYLKMSEPLDREVIDSWLRRAAAPGASPMTLDDPVLAELAAQSDTIADFAFRAATAIENAADRGVSSLDGEALAEARDATPLEANTE